MDPSKSTPSPSLIFFEGNRTSEEHNRLLLSLPEVEDQLNIRMYQYQGFWLNSYLVQGFVNAQTNFCALPSDVLLATTPKSGTTWLKAIIFSLLNRRSHPIATSDHPLTTHNPHELVPYLEIDLYGSNQLPDLSAFSSVRFFATHMPFSSLPDSVSSSKCKIVYLCRDPKDTFVSMWHFINKTRPSGKEAFPLVQAFERFCSGVHTYGPLWDHVLGYWNASLHQPSEVLFLKYEEIKQDPTSCVKTLARFLECPFSSVEEESGMVSRVLGLCSFDSLSNLKVNKEGSQKTGVKNESFFRRGEVGDWENYLTPEMVEKLESINEEKFHDSGLKF